MSASDRVLANESLEHALRDNSAGWLEFWTGGSVNPRTMQSYRIGREGGDE